MRIVGFHLICLSTFVIFTMVASESLRIGAFNIQIFGRTKVAKPEVVTALVQIILRYDITFVQEIRDSSGQAMNTLLEAINNESDLPYDLVISKRLGRTKSKEQYAFIYKSDKVSVVEVVQDPDIQDLFEREPYAVKFRSENCAVEEFVLVGIHVDKDDAVAEINHLKTFHSEVLDLLKTENILIMGDFNAGGSYVSKRNLPGLHLKTEGFHWLIPDDADTTVSSTHAAYDRFVMSGEDLYASLIPGSAQVYRFDEQLGLTIDEAKAVSDHYPIELSLRCSQRLGESLTVVVELEDEAISAEDNLGCCGLPALFSRFVSWTRKKFEL